MAEENGFFTRGKNKGNERSITIKTPQGLVSRKPTNEKRIKFRIEINLTSTKSTGMPSWLEEAFLFVSKNHQVVTESRVIEGMNITLDDDGLFGKPVVATGCKLRGFVIDEQGPSEDPLVYLHFLVYTGYTDKVWRWLGQLMGKDVFAKFEQVLPSEETQEDIRQLKLTGDSQKAADPDDDAEAEISAYEKKVARQAKGGKVN